MDSSELIVAVGSFVIHQCLFRALEHTTKVRALYCKLQAQNAAKSGKRAGDAAPAEASAKKSSEDEKKARDDCKRLWSCYLSHMHCVVTLGSCLWFWASRPVDVYSPIYMVEVRAPVLSHVSQRRELAAAVTATASHCKRTRTRTRACMHACAWPRTSPNDHKPVAAVGDVSAISPGALGDIRSVISASGIQLTSPAACGDIVLILERPDTRTGHRAKTGNG